MFAFCLDMPGVTREFAALVDDGVGPEPVEGLLAHVSGPCAGGWRIIDVWASESDQDRFQSDRLGPAVARAQEGVSSPPVPFDFRAVAGDAALSRLGEQSHV